MKAIKGYFAGTHRIRYLLAILIVLVVADGLISVFLVRHGFGREGNPFLESLIGEPTFMIVKVVGALLCGLILWDIYKQWPKVALIATSCFVVLYSGILFWNILVFFITQV